ncbi:MULTISPECIES: hypothetical protein [Olivibacter]|uniref:Uncharacterized protein n=2 Tax=Sphingobacteriaceae TaxID=84566 RepID=F4C2K5_SPHS2|nr:hypothetical protein [Olivibacter sp. UJ_SKK_5.1]MDX3914273.1 hypothetical protein [Pseudosphingobacterium sp.]
MTGREKMVDNDKNSSKTKAEEDYVAHKENPGPAPEAFEKTDRGSGRFLFLILALIVVILIIVWMLT